MKQRITSARTSRPQVPSLIGLVDRLMARRSPLFWAANSRCLDMGGGKYDFTTELLREKHGVRNFVIDPFNQTQEHNDRVEAELTAQPADFAICANVLNVIHEVSVRRAMHAKIKRLTRKNGLVFFTVHEGNGTSRGQKTSEGWQANKPTKNYERELRREYVSVERRGKLFICQGFKEN